MRISGFQILKIVQIAQFGCDFAVTKIVAVLIFATFCPQGIRKGSRQASNGTIATTWLGLTGRMCDAAGGDMVEFTKTIKDPLGLHARPVALLYDIIAKHRSDVSVSIGDRHTDGRDVMGLMALYGECGEDIIFRVSGVDEASCVTSIRNLSL